MSDTCKTTGCYAFAANGEECILHRVEKAEARVAEMQVSRDLALDQSAASLMRAERLEVRVVELETMARKQAFELGWPCSFCGWDQSECQCKAPATPSVSHPKEDK